MNNSAQDPIPPSLDTVRPPAIRVPSSRRDKLVASAIPPRNYLISRGVAKFPALPQKILKSTFPSQVPAFTIFTFQKFFPATSKQRKLGKSTQLPAITNSNHLPLIISKNDPSSNHTSNRLPTQTPFRIHQKSPVIPLIPPNPTSLFRERVYKKTHSCVSTPLLTKQSFTPPPTPPRNHCPGGQSCPTSAHGFRARAFESHPPPDWLAGAPGPSPGRYATRVAG